MDKNTERLLDFIKSSRNINQLPTLDDIFNLEVIEDPYECIDTLTYKEIAIADGSIIEIRRDECFKSGRMDIHDLLYYIPSMDAYFCMECGIWQKYYEDSYNEVVSDFKKRGINPDECFYELKLLPLEWSKTPIGIKKYFIDGIEFSWKKWEVKNREWENRYNYYHHDDEYDGDNDNDDDEYDEYDEYE